MIEKWKEERKDREWKYKKEIVKGKEWKRKRKEKV